MTNQEYEAASITAAGCYGKCEGEHLLAQCDKAIAVLEQSLARLQAERREIVNRYDLNKPSEFEVALSQGVQLR